MIACSKVGEGAEEGVFAFKLQVGYFATYQGRGNRRRRPIWVRDNIYLLIYFIILILGGVKGNIERIISAF